MEAAKRIGKRALTLSFAMLRADALFEKFEEEMEHLKSSSELEAKEELLAELEATKRMKNTHSSRAHALMLVLLGTLYAVVEKWQEWEFLDATVDQLLKSSNVGLLKKCRHTVFHADYYDHQDLKRFNEKKDILPWLANLAAAIRDYLKRWHSDPISHIEEHLTRVGL